MTTNIINAAPFVKTTRSFPTDPQALSLEINKGYLDLANAINFRTIGIFPTARSAFTGESWYLRANQKQQTIRQVYTFTAAGNIVHGLNLALFDGFTNIYGTFTDGTNWYPLPYVDVVNANNQVNVVVTPTNIVITAGAGAPPAITNGRIVLEYLSFS